VFSWAVLPGVELAERNPAKDVPYIEAKGDGHHSWTDAEVARYEARHPVGTTARLAMALLLFTSQRRSDVVLFGPKHVHAGWLHFTIYLEIPIQSELQDILDATPLGADTFLINAFGRPFSVAGFGNWFRERCDEAGLKHCSAHGLRKAAARRLAENDRSSHQIMAITGHTTLKEVDRYTRAANQRKLAVQAFSPGDTVA
jgi:integrase